MGVNPLFAIGMISSAGVFNVLMLRETRGQAIYDEIEDTKQPSFITFKDAESENSSIFSAKENIL